MIIHSPIFSGSISQDPNNAYANLSGSFTGSFKGIGDFEGLVADSVEYANVNNKPTLVSGSSQISYPEISDIPSGIISSSTQIDALFNLDGIVSSSEQISNYGVFAELQGDSLVSSSAQISNYNVFLEINGDNVVSSSQQISNYGIFAELQGDSLVSSSAQISAYGVFAELQGDNLVSSSAQISNYNVFLEINGDNVVSGSSQVSYPNLSNIPSGIVSGSSQVNADTITNFDSNVKDKLNSDGVISGSSQVTISSTSGYTDFSSSLDSRISTEKGRVDAILASADADKDSFAEIVTLINSVDTTNDQAFAAFYTSSNNTNTAQDARLSSLEAETGSITTEQAAQDARLSSLETKTGSLDGVDSAQNARLTSLESYTGSFASATATLTNKTISGASNTLSNIGNSSLTNSSVTINGTSVSLGGTATIPNLVSGSSQVNADTIVNFDTNVKDKLNADGVVSGSAQVDITLTTGTLDISSRTNLSVSDTANVDMILTGDTLSANLKGGVVSGSAQITYSEISSIPAGIVSGSTQITPLLPTGVISGSVQVLGGTGIVSGSSQIDYNSIANQPTIGNGTITITAGSGLDGGGSFTTNQTGASTITLTVADGVVSGSSQVSYPSLSNIPAGIVSGSTQITPLLPTGVISGSSQVFSNVSGDILIASNGVATIQANSVALGTDTTGNYVATLGTGTGVTIGSNTGEGSTPTIAVNYGSTSNTAVQGNTNFTLNGTANEIDVTGTAAQALGGGPSYTVGLADTITGNRTFSNNVTISGNLTVSGTTTQVNSTTVQIGDNIIELNGSGATNGGIYVKDATASTLVTGSLLWDTTNDKWIAGPLGSEVELVTISGTQTLTNKTINGSQLVDGSVSNAKLTNSTISGKALGSNLATLTIGTGLSGTSYNGSAAVTIANTGVTSITGTANQVVASASTGGVTLSLPQSIGTTSTVQFGKVGVGGASDATYELKVTGDIGATGDIVAYVSSDERLKNNVELISNPIEKVQSLRGVTWEWNELASEAAKQSPNVGVIAQEVEKVLPQLVHDRENGFKGVDYAKLTGLLIEAIKEQQKQIEELKSKLG